MNDNDAFNRVIETLKTKDASLQEQKELADQEGNKHRGLAHAAYQTGLWFAIKTIREEQLRIIKS